MEEIVLKWLKTKRNYIYFSTQESSKALEQFTERISELLFSSRMHIEELEASESYIIQKRNNLLTIEHDVPTHHKQTYKSYNIDRNEYIYDKAMMYQFLDTLDEKNTPHNRSIIFSFLKEIKHRHDVLNKFIEKHDKFSYKNFFDDFKASITDELLASIYQQFSRLDFDYKAFYEDFKLRYLDRMKSAIKNIEELGIFYPFKIDHDIFEKKHYLLEINHLKFLKKDATLMHKINKFHDKYGVNCDKSKPLFSLEAYFAHPGGMLVPQIFAYFDPFKYKEKYMQPDNMYLFEFVKKSNNNLEEFVLALFDLFNMIQYSVIRFQHENLIDMIIANRSLDRICTLEELIEKQIKQLSTMPENDLEIEVLKFFYQKCKNKELTMSSKIDDLGLEINVEPIKSFAQIMLLGLQTLLGKDSSLEHIITIYENSASNLIQKYHLNKKCQTIIFNTINDLCTFYNDKQKEKFSRRLNSTLYDVYSQRQKLDFYNEVNFNFVDEFIGRNKEKFETYKPCKIGNKYLMYF